MQVMRRVALQRSGCSFAYGRLMQGWSLVACILIGGALACGHAATAHRPSVGIAPFEALGARSDAQVLRGHATYITYTMRQVLESDSTVQVLAADPRARPRDRVTHRVEGIGHMVYGSLIRNDEGTLVLSWRLVAVEDGSIVAASNVLLIPGSEADSVTKVGQRIAALLVSASIDST